MTPYVVINGKSSKEIRGLLIQSLPPISKPKLRTTTEEIEGVDGDNVIELGYSAYDKSISIGLHGDYNVDDVITFFNTSGKITFSNENDKYYKFKQLDTIDFNKLVRFKTATVNFHVQPFKYLEIEPPIRWEGTGTIAELSIRNLGNIYAKPKLKITSAGNTRIFYDGKQVLEMDLGTGKTIVIDSDTMNATDEAGNFLNRIVTGDYNKLRVNSGRTGVRITGQPTEIEVTNYNRWI